MKKYRLIWPPAPFSAGCTVVDDTDAATHGQVKAVYDFLKKKNFPITKTVWAFEADEKCGLPALPDSTLRGVTLEDAEYAHYCKDLLESGFEICLHGASAGNNKRGKQQAALDLIREEYGAPGTFICHSKNADNLYWEENVTALQPFRYLLGLYSKHNCSGERPDSEYFWGDLCREHVRYIRLLRTRNTNTLAANPSMPYHDPAKPFVRSWFSATKRSLRDCSTEKALRRLRRESGLTVLYQYMHRYADPATHELDPDLIEAVDRITEDRDIYIAPVSTMMARLESLQRVFVFFRNENYWMVNLNDHDVPRIQLAGDPQTDERLEMPLMKARSMAGFHLPKGTRVVGSRVIRLRSDGTATYKMKSGSLFVNCSSEPRNATGGRTVDPTSWLLEMRDHVGSEHLSILPRHEEARLLLGQTAIILREFMFKGRSIRSEKYLGSDKIKLEDHSNW